MRIKHTLLDRIVIIFLIMMMFLMAAPVWSDNGHGHNHGGSDVDVTTGGSNSDSSVSNSVRDSSRAFGFGLGDVDINDCRYSVQGPLSQWTRTNWWCVAREYNALGLHEAAARVRCEKVGGIAEMWDSIDACIEANTIKTPTNELILTEPERHYEEEQEFHEEQQMLYADLQSSIENLQMQSEQNKRLAAKKQQEDKQYAQQMLQELEQWK